VLPASNRQFALPWERRAGAERAPARRLSVACYPQRYDSVSYYLPDADVRVYTAGQKRELLRDLRRGDTLLVVKSGHTLRELLAEWPDGIELVSRGKPGAITVGWVRVRGGPPLEAVACRD
jgi:hypothetical protein